MSRCSPSLTEHKFEHKLNSLNYATKNIDRIHLISAIARSPNIRLSWMNFGRSLLSESQHSSSTLYLRERKRSYWFQNTSKWHDIQASHISSDACSGFGGRFPACKYCINSRLSVVSWNGVCPRVKTSHTVTPNAHTSEASENCMDVSNSMAAHLHGSLHYASNN